MLPDIWLANPRVKSLWRTKFPEQPKIAMITLVEALFGTLDLTRNQVSILINTLEEAETWPTGTRTDGIDPEAPEESFGAHVVEEANRALSTPDWVCSAIAALAVIPNDVSVLDLCSGIGSLAAMLPDTAFYEGHDINPVQIARARRNFPDHTFKQTDLWRLLQQEPETTYGLVVCDTIGVELTGRPTCLELVYRSTDPNGVDLLDATAVLTEIAVKCAVRGGIVAIVGRYAPMRYVVDWLRERGTVLVVLNTGGDYLLLFRNGVRNNNHETHYLSFSSPEALTNWVISQPAMARVPVCPTDPRPLVIRPWEIELTDNQARKNQYASCAPGRDVELLRTKHGIGVRFNDQITALEWAQHQALTAPPEESWDKTVSRFNQRLKLESYLQVRQGNLNTAFNLPAIYTVREDPALTAYLHRYARELDRLQLSYPEKTTLENRYYTLGIGSVLKQGDDEYEVRFSEPDFSNSKPPKVHIEKVSGARS